MTNAGELSRLVLNAQRDGTSYQQLADRAHDPNTDTALSKPYLQKLATGTVTTAPTPERLRALAASLRIPLRVVQAAAAAQFLDYRPDTDEPDEHTRVIVAHLLGMTPADRRRWRAMVEAAVQADQETS